MVHSTKAAASKPEKPSKDFPMYAHGSGQWAKRIRGTLHYFGSWRTDPTGENALDTFEREWPYLKKGQAPPPTDVSDGCTLALLCNSFMDSKQAAVDDGDLSPRTLADYYQTVQLFSQHFGRDRIVTGLTPLDFREFRSALAKRYNTNSLKSVVNKICVILNYGLESRLFDRRIEFGGEFKRPSAKAQRRVRNQRGPKLFHREEILRMIKSQNLNLRAMVFLGVNCGFGNSDCATVPISAFDLERGWVTYPRPKTEIPRRIPLWSETIEAIQVSFENRPKPADKRNAGLFFLTTHGEPYVRVRERKDESGRCVPGTPIDSVSREFSKLLKRLGIHVRGLNFYTLRHVFETQAGESKDQVAVDAIMGHQDQSMAATYRHGVSDDRLRAVVGVVHGWLFADAAAGPGGAR